MTLSKRTIPAFHVPPALLMRNACRILVLACCLLAGKSPGAAKSVDIRTMARDFEIKPLPAKPSWASSASPPLLTFAWISDCHLTAGSCLALVTEALHSIRDVVRPDFLVITGDNSAYAPAPKKGAPALPLPLRRQRAFRDLLRRECGLPTAIIPGDNWPWAFEKVFGSDRYSFDAAGIHFIFIAPDRCATATEGCAVFAPETWSWLTADLHANRNKPSLLFLHQNVVPPTFLESGRLAALLAQNPQVLATMTGHLHLDLEFRRGGVVHFVCPSLGRSLVPAYKVVYAYPDRLVLTTREFDKKTKTFAPTLKWQKVDIPERYRSGLHPLDKTMILRKHRTALPPRPRIRDQRLAERSRELLMPAMQFLFQLGVGTWTPSGPEHKPASATAPSPTP